jgi:hypothetical protein
MSNYKYDIVIVHGPNDNKVLPDCVEFIKKNVGGRRNIYIISYNSSCDIFTQEIFKDCKIYHENIFPFSKLDVNIINQTPQRDGWYLQQLLKLYVSFVIEEILDDYVIIDSDVIFLKNIEFKSDNKYIYNIGKEVIHQPYFEHMKKLHPTFQRLANHSGIAHYMLFNRDIIRELFDIVEKYHFSLTNENKPFWKIFLEQVTVDNRGKSGASEYELYFNFMIKNHNDKIIIKSINYEETSFNNWIIYRDFFIKNNYMEYVALHYYIWDNIYTS